MLRAAANLFLVATIAWGQAQQGTLYSAVAERLVNAINGGDSAAIEREFNAQMRAAVPEANVKKLLADVSAQLGRIQRLSPPDFDNGTAIYPIECERGVLDMKLLLDADGKIAGLTLSPDARPRLPARAEQRTALSLPFRGLWLTFWGGDTRELNQHHDLPAQTFAFDFIGVGPDGKTRKGQSAANEDYYAFGREIFAPADGVVTEAIDGVRDNTPGSMNSYMLLGNAVFIEHPSGDVSVLAHLKKGSVAVKQGDHVHGGQVIGLCGNSGNSSEPHLHYQLQNTPVIQDATGIKVRFQEVDLHHGSDTERKPQYSPVKGDLISAEN